MRKCKQVVSMLLVLCMMFAVISVGIVQGAAADGDGIYADPPSEPALLGDVNRDGRINGDDVLVLRKSITHNFTAGYLDYTKMSRNSIDFKVADCFKDEEYGIEEKIDGNDVLLLRQYIVHKPEAMDKGIGEPVYVDPTEPPTQAPTDASTAATITIYGLNGQSETKEFNVGDSFVVYTSLNVKKSGNDVQIAAASGDQNFTDSVLTLTSTIDSEQLFTDSDTVFPVFGNEAMGRLRGEGWVQYNASTPGVNNGFVFDSDDDLVIVTEYTVTKGGTGEVRNALSYLAAADIDLTGLVKEGAVASGVDLTVNATFEKPMPAATEAPTQAPKPTTAPTQAPKPTTAPTQAPKPTTAPTQAPKPTTAPTQAPKPTTAPTQAQDKAIVTVYGLDGRFETKEFNVGEDFYVYTTLNASQINSGKIGSINGCQLYPNAMIKLIDEYDEEGIIDLEDMFPITGNSTMASGHHTSLEDLEGPVGERFNHDPTRGTVAYTASIASSRGFRFDSNDDILIKTHYQVTALGEAAITNEMRTLSASDDSLTQLIEEWEIVNPNFRLHASFLPPDQQPTDGPMPTVAPTQAPKPTQAPTQAPKPTTAPTQAPKPTQAPTEPAPEDTYIVAGNATAIFGTSWNGNDTGNTMTKGSDGIYTKQYTIGTAMKDVQLKAVKNGTTWIGDETGNNVTFNLTGAGTFTVYCDGTKTWVDGDIVTYDEGLDVQSVTAVGNGSLDGDNWLNNISWDPAAAANHMTKVAEGVYEIEYTLGEYDTSDPEFKFAVNDAWTHNFGLGDNGVIANGVTTDAIYNGPKNLKIEGLTAGTVIKMQLDLTGFDFTTKTGAKMTVTWTAPTPTQAPTQAPKPTVAPTQAPKPTVAPTQAPKPTVAPTQAPKPTTAPTQAPKPTTAPTQAPKPTTAPTEAPKPTTAPTQAPTQPQGKATVTVYGLDGRPETKEFNVGEDFYVYTTLNASQINSGKIGSINGCQLYPNASIKLMDEYNEDGIVNLEEMFPVTGAATMASGHHTTLADLNDEVGNRFNHDSTRGVVAYTASIGSNRGFRFDSNDDILIKTHYQVTAPGDAVITNEMRTLSASDDSLTQLIDEWEIVNPNFRLHASFLPPDQQPTDGPAPTVAPTQAPKPTVAPTQAPKPTTAPTQAPKPTTAPTQAPTQAPKPTTAPTQAPTQPQGKATVTVYGLDGRPETKEFNVGDDFYVYTTLNASQINSGKIGSINGCQLYPNASIKLMDEYNEDGIVNLEEMFPVTGAATMASGHHTTLADLNDEVGNRFNHDSTRGVVAYTASIGSKRGFPFNSNDDILIKVHYQVTAPGDAVITNEMRTLSASDDSLTQLIDEWEIVNPNFRLHASFLPPEQQPTDAPTEAPKPTVAPTQAPKPTTAPTQAPTTPPVTLNDGYYLVGTMTDWKADAAYMFSENTANPGEYMLSTALSATDGIKAVKVENGAIATWYPDGMDNEYVVDAAHAGDVTIYFKPTYQSAWSTFGGYLYIDTGSTPTPDPTTAPTEAPDVTDRTIIFSNNKGFSTVNIYYWSDEDQPVDWPGVPMTYYDTNEVGEKRYSFEMPEGMTYYIINDGTQQTVDITFSGATGVYLTNKDNSDCYEVAFYDIGKTDPTLEPTTAPQPTQAPEPDKNYVYLAPNIWDVADATERFQLYVWNDDGDRWITGTAVNGKYQFEVPTGFTDGIFVRMDSAKAADDWSSVWNQTGDLTLQIGKTYTITSWTGGDNGNSGGSWS